MSTTSKGLEIGGHHMGCTLANTDKGCGSLKGERPHGGLMPLSPSHVAAVIDLCPKGMPDRFRGPLHE